MGGKEPSGNLCGDRSNEVSLFHKKTKKYYGKQMLCAFELYFKTGSTRWRDKIYADLYRKSCNFKSKIREIIFPAKNPGTTGAPTLPL
jgi:hypothetical protein